jgi:hypothetical protein
MQFDLQPDDQIIPAGHQIGLMIFSSDRDFTLWPTPGRESCRPRLEATLRRLGLFWDVLVMGAGNGPRVLINDSAGGEIKAHAVNIPRNTDLSNVLEQVA